MLQARAVCTGRESHYWATKWRAHRQLPAYSLYPSSNVCAERYLHRMDDNDDKISVDQALLADDESTNAPVHFLHWLLRKE